MRQESYEFWIDVGGTFTDCIGRRPDGSLVRTKVLSTGVMKGSVGQGSTREWIVDPLRTEPVGFWAGATVRLLDAAGRVTHERQVGVAGSERSDGPANPPPSAILLRPPLTADPEIGQSYELVTGEEAPLLAIRLALGIATGDPLPPLSIKLGTTRGTNALLTRRGAKVAFVTTRGLGDVLRIGYQNRPKLFELAIRKPLPLFATAIEIDERLAADGTVLTPLDENQAREQFAALKAQDDPAIEAVAICLLHATANPAHERRLAESARAAGFAEVSVSHEVAPLVRIVPRGDTTVVDAYLNPVLRDYVARLTASLAASPSAEIRLLTSAGGLVAAERFTGKDSILSGPAGGVVGFSRVAQAAGFARAIGFDMGGTSTDVARFDGRFEIEHETQKAGVRIVAPMLAIETVAAGGGSICRFDGAKLVVGPESAGADPGPASYGRGGPLAVTDLNVWLGKIVPAHFPFPLDRAAVARRLDALIEEIEPATGKRYGREELAAGFLRVANANMAQAIRSISVAKGYDPRDYALVAFGGAAMQHACAVAGELGMTTIVSHPDAGLLSAYGIGLADVVRHRVEGIYATWNEAMAASVPEIAKRLAGEATEQVEAEGVPPERIAVSASLELRYQGVDASLTIPWLREDEAPAEPSQLFAAEHRRLYGYEQAGRPLELVAVRVEAVGRSRTELPRSEFRPASTPAAASSRKIWFEGRAQDCPVYERKQLVAGDWLNGPAVVVEFAATTVIDPGWEAEMLTGGELVLTRAESPKGPVAVGSGLNERHAASADPVELEIFHHRFAGIAERMGITLRQTASSVNVKERLDFSCAIFTATGDLVVNAPHIPVHLGAMGETVRRVLADTPDLAPGDVIVTNDPYRGGSHLPDVTVVTPVHDAVTGELLFFTASRAHHAEIGGIRPGSMPPFSKNLAEEGVVLRNVKAIAGGVSRLDELERLLRSGPFPSRAVADNLADTSAQMAANQQGVRDLLALVAEESWPIVRAYMRHIQDAAERKTRTALSRLPAGTYRFVDHLDDGSPIAVAITIADGEATIDFAGTGPVLATNLNANRAIVTAAVMYVLRCLLDEEIPLNQGVLSPVRIVFPECLLNPPAHDRPEDCPAVVGGNVETSQRVVDALLGALSLAAASQGTMNNLLFGDDTFGYYETICGGSGATSTAAGADAIHTHMTNTRLTDPEVLERRYPVRLREFAIRRGSGGAGQHRGGDGVLRRIEFLRPLRLSLLTTRRGPYPPYGLAGGSPGALGTNTLHRANGAIEPLPGAAQVEVQPGDTLVVETPGGGGWGEAVADLVIVQPPV